MRALAPLIFAALLAITPVAHAEPRGSPQFRLTVEHHQGASFAGLSRDAGALLITNLADGRLYRREADGRMSIFGPELPHGVDSFGDPAGPYRVERAGSSYLVAQGWTPANQPASPFDHALLRISDAGAISVISSDLWNPYDFAISGSSFIVVDAARNSLERVSAGGSRETVFVFKRLKTTGVALQTLSPTEFTDKQAIEFDAVPTGIATHDGRLYVSLFGGFPFLPGSGRVVSLADKGAASTVTIELADLNAPVDVAFEGPHSMLVLEHGLFEQANGWKPGSGRLLSIDLTTGTRQVVLDGMTRPVSVLVIEPGAIVVCDLGGNLYFLNHR